jgi:hypothetical protein
MWNSGVQKSAHTCISLQCPWLRHQTAQDLLQQ